MSATSSGEPGLAAFCVLLSFVFCGHNVGLGFCFLSFGACLTLFSISCGLLLVKPEMMRQSNEGEFLRSEAEWER
jgi:hypothetical protein